MKIIGIVTACFLAVAAFAAAASGQTGPVAMACGDDIAQLRTGKAHDGNARICLETSYDEVPPACKAALDMTGDGRGNSLSTGGRK